MACQSMLRFRVCYVPPSRGKLCHQGLGPGGREEGRVILVALSLPLSLSFFVPHLALSILLSGGREWRERAARLFRRGPHSGWYEPGLQVARFRAAPGKLDRVRYIGLGRRTTHNESKWCGPRRSPYPPTYLPTQAPRYLCWC